MAQQQKKYNVLVATYKDAGTTTHKGDKEFFVRWKKVGEVNTFAEAKGIAKNPILEYKNKDDYHTWLRAVIEDQQAA